MRKCHAKLAGDVNGAATTVLKTRYNARARLASSPRNRDNRMRDTRSRHHEIARHFACRRPSFDESVANVIVQRSSLFAQQFTRSVISTYEREKLRTVDCLENGVGSVGIFFSND